VNEKETVSDGAHEVRWGVEGAAYLKERLVILREDLVGGQARVTVDEERVL